MAEWTLHEGDCLLGLAQLEPESVDCLITDAPYCAHVHFNVRHGGQGHDATGGTWTDLGYQHMTDETRATAGALIGRAVRRWVVVFTAAEEIGAWIVALQDGGLEHVRVGCWVKPDAAPQFTGDRPGQGWEPAVIAHRPGAKRWNGGGTHAVWRCPVEKDGRTHPAQKPLALMQTVVRLFSDPGELVCDPFTGSGTTGVAALRLGRRFLGWEREARYAEMARRRLGSAREQLELCA